MISMNLHQASAITGATLIGKPIGFTGVSTDSRQDCKGKLFVALTGENFNGEDFCLQAIENGAVAVLVSHSVEVDTPQLVCSDTLQALSELAKSWARRCHSKVIAITGSNGKTTVKNMVTSILSVSNSCLSTSGNYNNEIGVPLTLCRMDPSCKYAVIEMGAAKTGDIEHLVSLIDINVAVLTNVSEAHIGRFGSLDNIISEKGKIASRLNSEDIAVLPADDNNFENWSLATKAGVVSFGLSERADVRVLDGDTFSLRIKNKLMSDIQLPVPGIHNRINAAAASAVAVSLGISDDEIKSGLENFEAENGRLQIVGQYKGNLIINDSYNANLQSVKAAIDVLSGYKGNTTLVFGDMAELGENSREMHSQVGHYASEKNINNLLTYGNYSQYAGNEFSDHPMHFGDFEKLEEYMTKHWKELGTILVKGSRSMHMENLIDSLMSLGEVA